MDKSTILKAIEDKRVIQAPPSLSPQRYSRVPQVPQADLPSVSTVHEGSTSLTMCDPVDALLRGAVEKMFPFPHDPTCC